MNDSRLADDFPLSHNQQHSSNRLPLIIFSLLISLLTGSTLWRELQLNAARQLIHDCIETQNNCADNLDAVEQLVKAKKSLQLFNLESAHLENAHLENANLKSAHLESAHLENAHLENVHLENANLSTTQLSGAHLENAHLENVNLSHAHLEHANLYRANLQGAYISHNHLQGAHLNRAIALRKYIRTIFKSSIYTILYSFKFVQPLFHPSLLNSPPIFNFV